MSESPRRDALPIMSDERPTISRRELVKLLAMSPVVASFGWSPREMERAAEFLARQAEEGDQNQAYQPAFFTAEEWRTVRILADYVIPRDAKSGSATDARAPEFVDFMLVDESSSNNTRNSMRNGLNWLNEESQRRFTRTFADATDAQRRQLLDDIAWPARAPDGMQQGVSFFNSFRDRIAAAFFSSAMGWQDLDYMGHTFVPEWQGCPEPALRKLNVSYDLMNTRVRGVPR